MIDKKKALLNTLKQQVLSLKMQLEQLNRPSDKRQSMTYQSAQRKFLSQTTRHVQINYGSNKNKIALKSQVKTSEINGLAICQSKYFSEAPRRERIVQRHKAGKENYQSGKMRIQTDMSPLKGDVTKHREQKQDICWFNSIRVQSSRKYFNY